MSTTVAALTMADAVTAALGRLYAQVLRLAGHRHAEPALAAVAFTENSFFPCRLTP